MKVMMILLAIVSSGCVAPTEVKVDCAPAFTCDREPKNGEIVMEWYMLHCRARRACSMSVRHDGMLSDFEASRLRQLIEVTR